MPLWAQYSNKVQKNLLLKMRKEKKYSRRKSPCLGFTLMELVTVVLIIGILVALATPTYFKSRLRGLSKTAISMLKTIRAAERAYYQVSDDSGYGGYYPPATSSPTSDLVAINSNLSTDLVPDKWDISIDANANTFTASAVLRSEVWPRFINLSITSGNENVTCSGAGCTDIGL